MKKDEITVENKMHLVEITLRKKVPFLMNIYEKDDLMQLGYIGLINAVEKFDESKGFKFETYAGALIEGEMRKINRIEKDMNIPRGIVDLFNSYTSFKNDGYSKEEIAKMLKVSIQDIDDSILACKSLTRLDKIVTTDNDDGSEIILLDCVEDTSISEEANVDNIMTHEILALLRGECTYLEFEYYMLNKLLEEKTQGEIKDYLDVPMSTVNRSISRVTKILKNKVKIIYERGIRNKEYEGVDLMTWEGRHDKHIKSVCNWVLENRGKKPNITSILDNNGLEDTLPTYRTKIKNKSLERLLEDTTEVFTIKRRKGDKCIDFWLSSEEEISKYKIKERIIDLDRGILKNEKPIKKEKEVLVMMKDVYKEDKVKKVDSKNKDDIVIDVDSRTVERSCGFNFSGEINTDTITPLINTLQSLVEISTLQGKKLIINLETKTE